MKPQLTPEEQQIVEYIEDGTAKSVEHLPDEMTRYTEMARAQTTKKKSVSIRLNESDLYLLKRKALETGLNYQNIIQSLIHQYTRDKIKVGL